MGKGMRAGKKKKPAAMNQAQQMAQMQALQQKMDEMQEEINVMEQSATSGGGAVEVTVNGKKQITAIKIEQEVVDPDDVEMLQDLIITAANEALRQMDDISQNKMNELTGSLGLPPGLI
jgi:DNA-binding protein, YbaB/EbfC family